MRELLVVIDYQNDFVTGALGNPAAAALEPGIAARVAAQLERGGRVLFTRDTHGTDYLNTREGRFLPVAHCIKGSQGWGLYGSLSQYETGVRDGVSIVDKPTFGCAALPAEAEALCGGAADSVDDVARMTGTINYEVLCDVGRRVQRVYVENGAEVELVDYLKGE